MFLLRSAFWFSFVALLMPHEPGLGGGSPTGFDVASKGAQLAASLQQTCAKHQESCQFGFEMLSEYRENALANLLRVKKELQAAEGSSSDQEKPKPKIIRVHNDT